MTPLVAAILGMALPAVLGIRRGEATHRMPVPEEQIQAHEALPVEGRAEDLVTHRGLEPLEIDRQSPVEWWLSRLIF